jgi:2-C-methyl-D-erythritol 4-phosphate cytidylyltransferase
MNISIVLDSGLGRRMNAGKNKVLLSLGGRPLIYYSLAAFEKHPKISQIILIAKTSELPIFEKIVKKYKFRKISAVIEGGKERQDSTYNGIKYLKKLNCPKNAVILFHNGANPFVTKKEIDDSIKTALKYGACAVAHPTKDTVKEVLPGGEVSRTLDRRKLWNMQTPQAIRFDLAHKAFERADRDKFIGTDDISLVERLGKKTKVVEGSLYNFKVTTPLDLDLAKIIIKKGYV